MLSKARQWFRFWVYIPNQRRFTGNYELKISRKSIIPVINNIVYLNSYSYIKIISNVLYNTYQSKFLF